MAFPDDPLEVTTELLLGGVWTDVSQYVYTREPITITAGRTDEGQRVEPSRCTLTLNNRDGRFSPRCPMSPYYGALGRNTPIRVSVPGSASYLLLDGTEATRAATPDHATLDVTGDIDIRVDVTPASWMPPAVLELAGKYDINAGNHRSWLFEVTADQKLVYRWTPDGTLASAVDISSTVPLTAGAYGRLAVRVTHDVNNGASGNTVTFYVAPTMAGPWTQLGDPIVRAGIASIFASTAEIELGSISNVTGDPMAGRYNAFQLRNGINGTIVANPDFTAQPPGTTSFADSAGRTWTLEGTAEITDREPRFTGEVSSWPAKWDVSGKDVWTTIEAAGALRRLGQGNKPIESTLRRAVPSFSPLAYWPMEEGKDAIRAYSPIPGVAPLKMTGVDWAAADTLASSNPLPALASNTGETRLMSGLVPAPPAGATGWQVRWVYRNDSPDATLWTYMRITTSGTVRQWFLQTSSGSSRLRGYDADDVLVVDVVIGTGADLFNQWVGVEFDVQQNGGNIDYRVDWRDVGGSAGGFGSSTAGTAGRVTAVTSPEGGYASALDGMAIGHISVWPTSSTTAYDGALDAWAGESTRARLLRLDREESRVTIAQSAPGNLESQALGPQRPAELLELLRDAADADGGILYEDRDRLALIYRHRTSLYNQTPTLSLDYTAEGEVGPPLEPVEDDQRLRNDVTVSRVGGSSGRYVVEDGPLSVQSPEDGGVGIYDESVSLNLATDEQAGPIAAWRAHLGTWDEARYPSIRLMLHAAPHLIEDWLRFQIGDRGIIANPPAWLPPGTIDFLGQGYTEVLDQFTWDVVLNATPAGPWSHLGVVGDGNTRADTAGSELTTAVDTDDTTLSVLTTEGPTWANSLVHPSDFPMDLDVGGETVRATALTSAADDVFGRTVANGWGAADIGGTWTVAAGTAANFAVGGGAGSHTLTTTNASRITTLPSPSPDVDLYANIGTSVLATGASLIGAVAARYAGVNDYYMARLEFTTGGAVILSLRKRVGGIETELATHTALLTHTAGAFYRLHFQIDGSTLRAAVWAAGGADRIGWQVEAIDTAITAAGSVGCRTLATLGNTNASPQLRFAAFELANPQRLTVSRSVNGIVKSHAAGTSVRLATPSYVAL